MSRSPLPAAQPTRAMPACLAARARTAEDAFVGGLAARLAGLGRYPDPTRAGGMLAAVAHEATTADRAAEIARVVEARRLGPDARRDAPRGTRTVAVLARKGWLGSAPALAIGATCALRLERHLADGGDDEPADHALATQALLALGLSPNLDAHVGILSPSGWAHGVTPESLSSPRVSVALLALLDTRHGAEDSSRPAYAVALPTSAPRALGVVLDPEGRDAKRARARRALARDPRLAPAGGLVLLGEMDATLGVEREILELAVADVVAADAGLVTEVVDGEWVLRRPRTGARPA